MSIPPVCLWMYGKNIGVAANNGIIDFQSPGIELYGLDDDDDCDVTKVVLS